MISWLNRNALLMFQHQIHIKSAETAETAQTLASLEALRSENLLVPQLTSSEQWQRNPCYTPWNVGILYLDHGLFIFLP